METAIGVLGVVVAIAGLWTHAMKLDLSTPVKAIRSAVEILSLVGSLVFLGITGLVIAVAGGVLGFAGTGLYLAIRIDEILTYAAIQMDIERDEARALAEGVRKSHRVFRAISQVDIAQLISELAQRGRSSAEVERMATPIAMLWYTHHRPPLPWLVQRFDALMRDRSEPASRAMRVADMISLRTKTSSSTFEETLEELLAGSPPGRRTARFSNKAQP